MTRLTRFILAAAILATPLVAQAGDASPPLRAVAQIQGLAPLSDQALAQIRGQGGIDIVVSYATSATTATMASCSGTCNVQHVSQVNSSPTGSNVVVIRQTQ
jgi:hypothetical protein